MNDKSKLNNNPAINELVFLENHINALIERIEHNGEYAQTQREKRKVINEVQILKRVLEYAQSRRKILETIQS